MPSGRPKTNKVAPKPATKMETLQLKDIVPYLPYKIEAITTKETYRNPSPGVIDYLDIEGGDESLSISTEEGYYLCGIHQCKLFLRPLSQLTQEIEHEGERFVPNLDPDFKFFIQADLDFFLDHVETESYHRVQKLFKWHFDVFGLNEKGLAIPKPAIL
jgi:hypothetical protein